MTSVNSCCSAVITYSIIAGNDPCNAYHKHNYNYCGKLNRTDDGVDIMEHTFLFTEGIWVAKGDYYDEANNRVPVEGKTITTHLDNLWINEGYMELQLEQPVRFENRYEIIPFSSDFTIWKSFNPALGTLQGKFAIIDDTIVSTYISEDGQYSGVKCVIKISDARYSSKGFAFNGSKKLSSWAVTMEKV